MWIERLGRFGLSASPVGIRSGGPVTTTEILTMERELAIVEEFLQRQDECRRLHPAARPARSVALVS